MQSAVANDVEQDIGTLQQYCTDYYATCRHEYGENGRHHRVGETKTHCLPASQ